MLDEVTILLGLVSFCIIIAPTHLGMTPPPEPAPAPDPLGDTLRSIVHAEVEQSRQPVALCEVAERKGPAIVRLVAESLAGAALQPDTKLVVRPGPVDTIA